MVLNYLFLEIIFRELALNLGIGVILALLVLNKYLRSQECLNNLTMKHITFSIIFYDNKIIYITKEFPLIQLITINFDFLSA